MPVRGDPRAHGGRQALDDVRPIARALEGRTMTDPKPTHQREPKDDLMATQNEIESDEVYEKYLSRYIPYYPLIAATIAVSFDVGCFYAMDISFFTLFSFSEHIVFALEALPIALIILLMITVILPLVLSRFQPSRPSTVATPNHFNVIAAIVVLVILLLGLISFVFYALYDMWRTSPALLVLVVILILPIIGAFIIDLNSVSSMLVFLQFPFA
jgi:hypothetical protein